MSYKIQLSAAQIQTICAALKQAPPQHIEQEVTALSDMFMSTLKEPENNGVLHGFTL